MRRSLAMVLAALALLAGACGGDEDSGEGAASDSPTTTTVAPRTCVKVSEPLPGGTPEVPVQEGPAPTELVVEDLREGDGAEVTEGATVTVDYIGVACSSGVVFDDSYSRGQPERLGLDQVIPGWSQGLVGMKVGGSRLLGIPAELAYGDTGAGADIGPGETLWFVVEIREVA